MDLWDMQNKVIKDLQVEIDELKNKLNSLEASYLNQCNQIESLQAELAEKDKAIREAETLIKIWQIADYNINAKIWLEEYGVNK
jgi:uncharacterized coiled-coil DUF342 family protein